MIKQKIKKKKCRTCKTLFEPRTTTQTACGYKCAIEQGKAKQATKERKQYREAKRKLKSYSKKMSELQAVFNELRRYEEFLWFKERNIEPYCISCLKPLGNDQWCNGHFKTTKARPELRFDKINSYLQHNHRCNQMLSGDVENYKIGLEYRFGNNEAKRIIEYCESHREQKRYSDEDIDRLKKEWRKEIKRIKSLL